MKVWHLAIMAIVSLSLLIGYKYELRQQEDIVGSSWVQTTKSGAVRAIIKTSPQGPTWQPKPVLVKEILAGLAGYLKTQPAAKTLIYPVEDYSMQFAGYTAPDDLIINVQAFCGSYKGDITKDWLHVEEKGPCYFHFSYSPLERRFFGFGLN